MKPPKLITVLLVEDHVIVREGIKKLFESESAIEVIGEAGDGRQAVALFRKLHPAVVVMDIALPLLNGMEAARQMRQVDPAARVLMLSAHSDDAYVEKALESGATGYLVKQTSANFLVEAILEVHKGLAFFSPEVARRIQHRNQKSPVHKGLPKANRVRLSSRETEVLQLIAEGKANKQVAAELGISIKTVEKHREHLMQKLDIHDTAGLTRYAIESGVIESSVQLTLDGKLTPF